MGIFNNDIDDEFEEVFGRFKDSGFEFDYNNRKLGKSRPIFKDQIDKLESTKHNNDNIPLFINCKACGTYMDFEEGPTDNLDGWYTCPVCGKRVKELTVYSQLNRENNAY